ncbi:uncharacterized protein LOC119582384 [Penaeus monodon]|uniref:uncharacterized protein LOC119582384 n=1 Tax=Penaeus monodon TaxID=6687 RepID=UPI0018A7B01D|nr:uncharacterized protein LOC119582384 [Penaeus monodon]
MRLECISHVWENAGSIEGTIKHMQEPAFSNKTSSADLLGLNLTFGGSSGTSDSSPRGVLATSTVGDTAVNRPMSPASNALTGLSSPAPSVSSITSPVLAPPPRADRYAGKFCGIK